MNMKEKQTQKAPKTVRLYPPIEQAWDRLEREWKAQGKEINFNYHVNMCLAEKLGIPIDLEKYHRLKGQPESGQEESDNE